MLKAFCDRFINDEQGAFAPSYALALTGIIAAAGVGYDYAQVAALDTEIQNAADQAALAAATQLDENPVRKVRILAEDLTLYRTTTGKLGLIGERCLHRLVDMQYGIPDECGLRCPYHGWLYDETGA